MNGDARTHGLWEATAPDFPNCEPLTGDVLADAVVVGAGFTGASAALHLAERGRRVVVLEANDIGFGGSGRNVGLVNAGMWVMPETLSVQLGDPFGERLLHQLGEAPRLVFDIVEKYRIDCEANTAGTLHCAVGERGLAEILERARQWRARDADVQFLDADETRRKTGSTAYSGALLDRRAGTIQPLAYARGLARAAMDKGATFHPRSPALHREAVGGAWRITAPAGSVTAPWVLVATDAYSIGPWSPLRKEQIMLPYFNLATAPLPADLRESILPGGQGAWDTKRILSSFRLDRSGRLIMGSVGALRGPGATIHREWGRRELRRLFPQLLDVSFEHQWYGQIGMTADALPRLHRHDSNIYSISGYNGRGIAPGTTFGRDLARLATGEAAISDLSLPLRDLDKARLRSAKTAFYELGAEAVHLTGSRP